jgi:hypothetical protein
MLSQTILRPRTLASTTRFLAWIGVALLVFFAVAGAAARPASAASVSPTAHSGNVTEKDNGCPDGDIVIVVDGSKASGSAGGVTIDVTYNDDNSLDFSATGGLVDIAYVKGGDNYNEYDYNPAVASDTNLVSPLNGGNQVPTVSHSVYCVQQTTTTTTTTSKTSTSSTSTCGCTTTSTTSTSTSETSSVSETTETTATTESSDVSDTTSTQQTETTSVGTSTSDTGGVGGETGRPEVTPPSTSTLPGSSGSSDGWRIILLGLAAVAVLSLILLPGEGRKSKQR